MYPITQSHKTFTINDNHTRAAISSLLNLAAVNVNLIFGRFWNDELLLWGWRLTGTLKTPLCHWDHEQHESRNQYRYPSRKESDVVGTCDISYPSCKQSKNAITLSCLLTASLISVNVKVATSHIHVHVQDCGCHCMTIIVTVPHLLTVDKYDSIHLVYNVCTEHKSHCNRIWKKQLLATNNK